MRTITEKNIEHTDKMKLTKLFLKLMYVLVEGLFPPTSIITITLHFTLVNSGYLTLVPVVIQILLL